jgi:hypothetical protein
MLVELGTGVYLLAAAPELRASCTFISAALLLAVIWASTAWRLVPIHRRGLRRLADSPFGAIQLGAHHCVEWASTPTFQHLRVELTGGLVELRKRPLLVMVSQTARRIVLAIEFIAYRKVRQRLLHEVEHEP